MRNACLTICLILTSFQLFGQKIKITDELLQEMMQIDSLFYHINPELNDILIQYQKQKTTVVYNSLYPEESDTLIISTALDSLEYYSLCEKENLKFESTYPLFKLLTKNKISFIKNAGVGDCDICSRIIYFDKKTALIVKPLLHWCNEEDCVFLFKKEQIIEVTPEIFRIKGLSKTRSKYTRIN